MREIVTSRLYMIKDWSKAQADHELNPSIVRKVRHPSLGLCLEVIYFPTLEEGK